MAEKRKQTKRSSQLEKRRREAEENRILREKTKKALENRANKIEVGRMVQGIMNRLEAQNTAGMTRQEKKNAEAARLVLQTHRAEKRRRENAAMMRQINAYGTMGGQSVRKQIAEEKYKRVLEKVMRQATYTPTDFKHLGKIVRARRDGQWSLVERLIRNWETNVKSRVCRMRKRDMQNMARGLNVPANRKKKNQLCQAIKNKI